MSKNWRLALVLGTVSLAACSGPAGDQGVKGDAGEPCTVTDNGASTTITCGAASATVSDGAAASCTAAVNAGVKTISCSNGTSITVADGVDGADCSVAHDAVAGTSTITCDNGTTATVSSGTNGIDGGSCMVTEITGGATIDCEDGTSVTVYDGTDVDPTTLTEIQTQLKDLATGVNPEACVVCHDDAGSEHQALYNQYTDASALELTIDSVVSVAGTVAGTFDSTMTFTVTKGGAAFVDVDGLPALKQKRFSVIKYNADGTFTAPLGFGSIKATATSGQYTATVTGAAYATENEDCFVYGYVADEIIGTEGMTLYSNVSNAALVFGAGITWTSAANTAGCEKCHGAPYLKHGYRAADVAGLPPMAACKTCHYDTRNGGHESWQLLVDNPARYAALAADAAAAASAIPRDTAHDSIEKNMTADERDNLYVYIANTMNDTHMSHAMEFAYPQRMSNCVTCHEGKIDRILSEDFFNLDTCYSCHAITGSVEYDTADTSIATLWAKPEVAALYTHSATDTCISCHNDAGSRPFTKYHSGYDTVIYTADGTRYSELFEASIDTAAITGNTLNVVFSVTEDAASTLSAQPADVVPTIMVGLYGWDSKDYIVGPHAYDADHVRFLELKLTAGATHPRITVNSAAAGVWDVDVDLTMWESLLLDGTVRRAEIAVMPSLTIGGRVVALNAPSRTFDLVNNVFDDTFYQPIVKVEGGCNNCHDALASTFHSADRGGSVVVCRMCHITLSGGSHLEMQSRSIDSYAHSIHAFQVFDPADIDFSDAVEAVRYEHHIESGYPNFTLTNCESCHEAGAYDVPDQAKSMPGLLSASDKVLDRNIGTVPAYITGPATRACGGCHRAHFINEDAAGELAAFNGHTASNGYLVVSQTGLLDLVITKIMTLFH